MSEDKILTPPMQEVGHQIPSAIPPELQKIGVISDEETQLHEAINKNPRMQLAGEMTRHHTEPEGTVQIDNKAKKQPITRRNIYAGYINPFTRILQALIPPENQPREIMKLKLSEMGRKEAPTHAAA